MKKKLSLNALLHKDRLVFVLSLVVAFIIWAAVIYGPSNIETRTVTLPVYVDLTGTYAANSGIRIVGDNTFNVEVQVQGTRAVIGALGTTDIRVKPNVNAIQSSGRITLDLTPVQNSSVTDYTFISVTPATITVDCDYWVTSTFPLTVDISGVQVVQRDPLLILGTPRAESSAVQNGMLTLEGPKETLSRIRSIVARVASDEPIAADRIFSTGLVATDAGGAPVDISACSISGLPAGTLNVTVPVLTQKEVPLNCQLQNVPAGLEEQIKGTLVQSASCVTLTGSASLLEKTEKDIADMLVLDLQKLLPGKVEHTFTLPIPDTVRLETGSADVTVTLDLSDYEIRTFTVELDEEHVEFVGASADKNFTVPTERFKVKLCGPADMLDQITAEQLYARVDVSGYSAGASVPAEILVEAEAADHVWVWYGDTGYFLTVTLQ